MPKSFQQRRHLTIMFTDLASSSSIAREMEPEEYSLFLDEIREKIVHIAEQQGGLLVRIEGDGFFFVFGYPEVQEDSASPAIRAALNMREAMNNLNNKHSIKNTDIKFRTAIHSGIVLLKSGNIDVGHFEILGESTNLTAHLCKLASPGEIIATNECLRPNCTEFELSRQHFLRPKGRKKGIAINAINGFSNADKANNSKSLGSTRFLGRDDSLNQLKQFALLDSSSPKLLLVQAEAGLGKSRLVYEFSTVMVRRGFTVHYGICEASIGVRPFHPVEQLILSIIRSEFDFTPDDLTSNSNLVPEYVKNIIQSLNNGTTKSDDIEEKINDVILGIKKICEEINQQRLILIIDDWHWADLASKKIVEGLISSGTKNLRVLLTSRTLDNLFVEMNSGDTLLLKPLSSAAMEDAVKSLIPTVEPFTLLRIKKYAGGNPLYLEELCHAVKNSPLGIENIKPGSWLNGLVYKRFNQLPRKLSQIVKVAATIGYMVPEWLLKEISDNFIGTEELKVLQETDFLYASETQDHLRFKHGITRDVIYEMIGLKERRALHSKIMQSMRSRAEVEGSVLPHDQLAFHSANCGDLESSIKHSFLAGEQALKNSALDKAQAHFKHILSQVDTDAVSTDLKYKIIHKYGIACIVDSNWEQVPVFKSYLSYAERLMDDKAICRAHYWLAYIYYALGEPNKSIHHYYISKDLAEKCHDNALLSQIILNLGQAYISACDYARADGFLDQAIQQKMASTVGANDQVSISYALSRKALALADQGKFTQAYSYFDQALKMIKQQKHFATSSVLNQVSVAKLWQGEFDETIRISTQVSELAKKVHSRYHYAMASMLIAAAGFYKSGETVFIEKMATSTEWMLAGGSQQCISLNFGYLCDAYAQTGDWKNARSYAAKAIKRARNGDRLGETLVYRVLARLAQQGYTRRNPTQYIQEASKSALNRNSPRDIEKTNYLKAQLSLPHEQHNYTHSSPELFYVK